MEIDKRFKTQKNIIMKDMIFNPNFITYKLQTVTLPRTKDSVSNLENKGKHLYGHVK